MEDDGLCLHLSILDIHLVPTQHNGNVFTNPYQVSMPVGNILVSDPGRHVKHDNCTLSLNVVAVSEPAKLLLAGCVPDIEADGPSVCVEDKRVYLYAQGRCRVKRADTKLTCSVAANLSDDSFLLKAEEYLTTLSSRKNSMLRCAGSGSTQVKLISFSHNLQCPLQDNDLNKASGKLSPMLRKLTEVYH